VGLFSLRVEFTDLMGVSSPGTGSCTITLGPYTTAIEQLQAYTVMANILAEELTCSVSVSLRFFDHTGTHITGGDITANGTTLVNDWQVDPGFSASGLSPGGAVSATIVITLSALQYAVPPPSPITITQAGTAGTTGYGYVATSVNAIGESNQSPVTITTTGPATQDSTNYNHLSWSAVTGATSYNVYRGKQGVCGDLPHDYITCTAVELAFSTCLALTNQYFSEFLFIHNGTATTLDDPNLPQTGTAPPTLNSTGPHYDLDAVGLFGVANVAHWTITPPGGALVWRTGGDFVQGASPLFPLLFTTLEAPTIFDVPPYGLPVSYQAQLTAGTASVPSVPTRSVMMGQAPETCALWKRMGWAADVDVSGELIAYLSGTGELLQFLTDIANDQVLNDGSTAPGWSQVLDIDRCPSAVLPWLGQFVGARLTQTGLRDDQMRYIIENAPAWSRGTVAAIQAAANLHLQSGYVAQITERTPDPYSLTVQVPNAGVIGYATCQSIAINFPTCLSLIGDFATCAALWGGIGAIQNSINASIPAGLIATINFY
jgi:hypothetical protein